MSPAEKLDLRARLDDVLVKLGVLVAEAPLGDALRLREDLGIDSLAMVRLVRRLNEAFSIRIRASEMTPEHFATVAALEAFIARKIDGD